jgi:SAM-dependent methyltransferase
MAPPQTWHFGLVAEWWAEFNTDGPEIDYFGQYVETGRLLLPWLRRGLDVDGCDVSTDMIEHCRDRALREGLKPTLFVQPLHELRPPRRYRTIVACGVLGLGSTRAEDQEALRRFHQSLEPGGTLLLDNEVPYANVRRWPLWTKEPRAGLPEPWPVAGDRKTAGDGSEYELRVRATSFDPLDQRLDLEMRADKWVGGAHVTGEEHAISIRLYFRDELLLMLERAGFSDVGVRGGHTDAEARTDDDVLVYIARR